MEFFGIVHKYHRTGRWTWGDTTVSQAHEIQRCPSLEGYIGFFTTAVGAEDWMGILGPRDMVFGGEPGQILGVRIDLEGCLNRQGEPKEGYYTIFSPKVWAIPDSQSRLPSELQVRILEKIAKFVDRGIPAVGNSIASTAKKWYDRFYNNQEQADQSYPLMTQLPPRWRELAKASFHGGPIACLRGGAREAVEIDMKGAYLHALTKPVPVVTSQPRGRRNICPDILNYVFQPSFGWEQLRNLDGFIEATVRVPATSGINLPPLPLATPTGIQYPVGRFRGSWTIPLLREAEEYYGTVVECVHQHAIAQQMEPLFRNLASVWSSMDKEVAKPLYTRFWGKFGFSGGWNGRISDEPIMGTVPKNGFWWTDNRYQQTAVDVPPSYRPDISAYIASYNHLNMLRAMRMLKPGSIIACHVDAIWTDDIAGAQKIIDTIQPDPYTNSGSWQLARTGDLRFWACGVYSHGSKLGYSGYDPRVNGIPTYQKIEDWISRQDQHHDMIRNRQWKEGIDSSSSKHATSRAIELNQQTSYQSTEGLPITSQRFTAGGWMARE